jgi:predicted ATPase
MQRRSPIFVDEPESALSPSRQIEFLKLLRRMEQSTICQLIMANGDPFAVPDGVPECAAAAPVANPKAFIDSMMED